MASDSSQVGALWRAEAEGSSGTELKSSVSVHSSRWRFEVRSRRRGNVSSQTHTQTHHIHTLHCILPTQPPPHLHVCSSYYQHSHSFSLPVNNSDQSVGLKGDADDRKRKRRRRRRTYQRSNRWVCLPHQTVAFDTISLHATALLGDFFFFGGLFTTFIIGGMLRHTSVWLIVCSFSFTWQLAAELIHCFESKVEWERCKVSPRLLCGHDVWTALAMFSGTDVRELHGQHAWRSLRETYSYS